MNKNIYKGATPPPPKLLKNSKLEGSVIPFGVTKRCLKAVIILAIALGMQGCASIFQGSSKDVTISSATEKTKIYVDGTYLGYDFVKAKLKRKKEHTITAKKVGYETENVIIRSNIQAGWIILDVLGGLVALAIDWMTGAWFGFDRDTVNFSLEKKENPVTQMQQAAPANTEVTPVVTNIKN